MARALRTGTKTWLWRPEVGIRFSSAPLPTPHPSPGPLYPRLDTSRFLQTASHGNEISSRPAKEASDVAEVPFDKDDSNVESIELCIKSTQLPRSSSSPARNASHDSPIPAKSTSQTLEQSATGEKSSAQKGEQPRRKIDVEPPSTSLSFNISPELFHAARSAKEGSSDSFWSHTMYERKAADGTSQKIPVHYCTSTDTMERVCKEHFLDEQVIGFDLEWSPFATRGDGARENVSLIQIASPDRIALFHVALFADPNEVPPTFRKIMEDETVSKVGVHIRGDCRRMKTYLDITVRGIFELSHLYKQVKFTEANTPKLINKVLVSLSTQVEDVLRLPLFKGDVVRSSNWMKRLNRQQVEYSASDAYAGIQLYHVLDAKRKMLDPCPERPHHSELGLKIPIVVPKFESGPPADGAAGEAPDASCSSADSGPRPAGDVPQRAASAPARQETSRNLSQYQDRRILAAEEKAAQYRASKTFVFTRPACLRAYFLWHTNHDLGPEAIARLLRDPPLQTNTVLQYILDAISVEKLPYDKARLKLELLPLVHEKTKQTRYRELVRSCGEDSGQQRGP
ncbi:hypothetical protein E4U41_003118 [Claviceps citrina]|nr:hypothetical protein E4U41_003118 [Claviceps citrina]